MEKSKLIKKIFIVRGIFLAIILLCLLIYFLVKFLLFHTEGINKESLDFKGPASPPYVEGPNFDPPGF